MKFYDDDNEEDEFTEEEISLAKSFCEACDKGIPTAYNEDEYDIIISNLMFSQKGDYLKKAIEKAQHDFPDDPEFVIWKMRYLIWNDQRREAQQYMQKTLRHFPSSAELYEEIAFIAYTFHLKMNVGELVQKAIDIEPSSNAYFILTNLYLDKGDAEKAFDSFKEAYRYDNGVLENTDLLILSNNDSHSGRFKTELQFLQLLCQEFPLDKQIWTNMGTHYALNEQHKEALQAFEFAVSIESDTMGLYAIAKEHYMMRNFYKAIEYCWRIHKSKDLTTHVLLGKAFKELNLFDEALQQLLMANEKDPEFPFAFSEIVDVLRMMGRLEEIPKFVDRYYETQQLSLEKLEWVLDCLRADGHKDAFLHLCHSAEKQFESPIEYCAWLTEFCYLVHCQDIAIKILEENYTDLPDEELYEHLGYFLALSYIADGKPKIGIQHLQNALILNEDGIRSDFLDLDTDMLYTLYPEIYMLVGPYSDHLPDIHNN
jgi:tetratricopeptide (TPR) repeat protein